MTKENNYIKLLLVSFMLFVSINLGLFYNIPDCLNSCIGCEFNDFIIYLFVVIFYLISLSVSIWYIIIIIFNEIIGVDF